MNKNNYISILSYVSEEMWKAIKSGQFQLSSEYLGKRASSVLPCNKDKKKP
jgi:glycine betaine/choline ABC-type transport system substrate-binding protein